MSVSGFTQLRVVDSSMIGPLLSRSLPAHWLQPDTASVEWVAGQRSQPAPGWLESLWNYLRLNSPYDLSAVERFPLVPVRAGRRQMVPGLGVATVTELVALRPAGGAAVVVRRADGLSLGGELELIAGKLGLTVVDTPPDFVRGHAAAERDYLFAPTYLGVLRAVRRRCREGAGAGGGGGGREAVVALLVGRATAGEKRRLRELFAKISAHELTAADDDLRDLLAHLPLFETLDGSGGGPSQFVSAAEVALSAPAERMSIPLSRRLLDVSSSDSQTLAQLLSVRRLEPAQLLTEVRSCYRVHLLVF